MQEQRRLVTYPEAMKLTGLSQRVFYRRLARAGISIFVHDRDRRVRLLDRADLSKLTAPPPGVGVDRAA